MLSSNDQNFLNLLNAGVSEDQYGKERADDKKMHTIAKTFVQDAFAANGVGFLITDRQIDKTTAASGMGAAATFLGTNMIDDYVNKDQMVALLQGLKPGVAESFINGSPAQRQALLQKHAKELAPRIHNVSVAILTAQSVAKQTLDIVDQLATTELNNTNEGRDRIIKTAYAIGTGIMRGEDAMNSVAADFGISLVGDGQQNSTDHMISSIAVAALRDDGYNFVTNISKDGLLGAISKDTVLNHKAVIGTHMADPYLISRELEIDEQGSAKFISNKFEISETEDFTKQYTSKFGYVALSASDMTLSGGLIKPIWMTGTSDHMSKKMRMAMINEAGSEGQYGKYAALGSIGLGMAAGIVETMLLTVLVGLVTGGTGAPTTVASGASNVEKGLKSWKTVKFLQNTGKAAISSKTAILTTSALLKNQIRASNETGYGFSRGVYMNPFGGGDYSGKFLAEQAFVGTSYALSLGFSEALGMQFTKAPLRGVSAAYYAKDAAKFYNNLSAFALTYTLADVVFDTSIDMVLHNTIEGAMFIAGKGTDPFTADQEQMTSWFGDTSVTMEGLGRQLATRFVGRVASKQLGTLFSSYHKPENKAEFIGSPDWMKEMDAYFGESAKGKNRGSKALFWLTRKAFNNSLVNVSSYATDAMPQDKNLALWKMMSNTNDPYKAYMTLWKMQELATNDVYNGMAILTKKKGGFVEATKNMINFQSTNSGVDNIYAPVVRQLYSATVLKFNSESETQEFNDVASKFILEGTSSKDMIDRLAAVRSYTMNKIIYGAELNNENYKIEAGTLQTIKSAIGDELIKTIKNSDRADNLVTVMKELGSQGAISDDQIKSVDYSSFEDVVLSNNKLANRTSFIVDKDNAKDLGSIVKRAQVEGRARLNAQYESIKQMRADTVADLNKARGTDPNSMEVARLEHIIAKIDKYNEIVDYDPSGKRAADGINRVVDFFNNTVKNSTPNTISSLINGEGTISGSAIADIVGASQAYSTMLTRAFYDYLGARDVGEAQLAIKGMSDNRFAILMQERVEPFINVLGTFYGYMDEDNRNEAYRMASILKGGFAQRKESNNPAGQMILSRFNALEQAILNQKEVAHILAGIDVLSQHITALQLLGHDVGNATRLAVALSSNTFADSDVIVHDQDGNEIGYKSREGYGTMLQHLTDPTRTIEEKIGIGRELMGVMAARSGALQALLNNGDMKAAVVAANKMLAKQFGVSVDKLPVSVTDIDLGDKDKLPVITVDSKDSYNDNKSLSSFEMIFYNSMMDTSAHTDKARELFQDWDSKHARSEFVSFDNKHYTMQELFDTYKTVSSATNTAIKSIAASFVATGLNDTATAITAKTLSLLYRSEFATTMAKFSTEDQKTIAWKISKAALAETHLGFEVTTNLRGQAVVKVIDQTGKIAFKNNDAVILNISNVDSKVHKALIDEGYIKIASMGAALQGVYIKLSARFKAMDSDHIINSLLDTYRLLEKDYDTNDTYAHYAVEELTKVSVEHNNGSLGTNNETVMNRIFDSLQTAWNRATVNQDTIPDDASTVINFRGKEVDLASLLPDYINKKDVGLRMTIDQTVSTLRSIQKFIAPDDGILPKTKEQLEAFIQTLAPDIAKMSTNITDAKVDGSFDGLIETLVGMKGAETLLADSYATMFNIEKLIKDFEQKATAETKDVLRADMVHDFVLDRMSEEDKDLFIADLLSSNTNTVDLTWDEIRPGLDNLRRNEMYAALRKAAFKTVGKTRADLFKSKDPLNTLANIIAITNMRGMPLSLDSAAVSKRISAVGGIGSSISKVQADRLVINTTNYMNSQIKAGIIGSDPSVQHDNWKIRLVGVKKADGYAKMAPELIKLFNTMLNLEDSGSFKSVVDFGGGMSKVVYGPGSNLVDIENGILTVEIDYRNLKLMSRTDNDIFVKAIQDGGYLMSDPKEISQFFRGHREHADTYSRVSDRIFNSQGETGAAFGFRTVSGSLPTGKIDQTGFVSGSDNLRDALFSVSRSVQNLRKGSAFMVTAGFAETDNPTALILNSSDAIRAYHTTLDNMNQSTYRPMVTTEAGIAVLAKLADAQAKAMGANLVSRLFPKIYYSIDYALEQTDKLKDMSKKALGYHSRQLLEFLSDDNEHTNTRGKHIIKSKSTNGETLYFMASSRSPEPVETTSFALITRVANAREGHVFRTSELGQMIKGGDFDGDLTLGLPPILQHEVVRNLAKMLYGGDDKNKMDKVKANFAAEFSRFTAMQIQKNDLGSIFLNSLVIDPSNVAKTGIDPYLHFKSTMALSGAIKDITWLKSIFTSVINGEIDLRHDFNDELIEKLAKSFELSGMSILANEVDFKKSIGSFLSHSGYPGNRLVLIDGNQESSIISSSLFPGTPVGSVEYHYKKSLGKIGTNNAEMSIVVTGYKKDRTGAKGYNILVVENDIEKLDALKIVGSLKNDNLYGDFTSSLEGATSVAIRLAGMGDEIVNHLDIKPYNNTYVASPESLLNILNHALVDTKAHGQTIIEAHYKGNEEKFIEHARNFATKLYAAALIDIGMQANVVGDSSKISYWNSSLRGEGSGISPKLQENVAFETRAAKMSVDEIALILNKNLGDINNLVSMVDTDNTVPLDLQESLYRRYTSQESRKALPGDVQAMMRAREGGGIGYGKFFEGIDKTSLDKFCCLGDDVSKPNYVSLIHHSMNKTKLDFWSDFTNIADVIKYHLDGMLIADSRQHKAFVRTIMNSGLYVDDKSTIVNGDIASAIYLNMNKQGIHGYSRSDVENMLRKFDVKLDERQVVRVDDYNSVYYALNENDKSRASSYSNKDIAFVVHNSNPKKKMTALSLGDVLANQLNFMEDPKNAGDKILAQAVYRSFMDVLSMDSRKAALNAASGINTKTVSHISKMFDNKEIVGVESTGGYRIKAEGLAYVDEQTTRPGKDFEGKETKIDIPIEERYKINQALDNMRRVFNLGLVDNLRKDVIRSTIMQGTGNC